MNYWQNRYENLKKNMEKDEDKLKKKLSFFYDKERVSLEKEIASFYQRYGENNIIEYRNLLQSLSMEEKDMLIKRADEFIEKYPKYKNILPVRENIYKLNRLEGLQYSILLKQYEIGAIEQEEIENHLRKYALKGANITYETLGFGKNFLSINSDVISKILDNSYAGEENFSDRIWNNKKKLADYLNKDFAQAVARGDSYDKCVKSLKERFSKVTRNDCYRLIFTEGTYVLNESTITPFEEDFESYEISTVGDGRVCSICRGIKGKVFNIKERTPGINFPPFHPWCRCSFEVVVDDWDKWLDDYESKHGKSGDIIRNRLNGDKTNGIIKENKYYEDIKQNTSKLNRVMQENDYKEYIDLLSKNENKSVKDIYINYADGVDGIFIKNNAGSYSYINNIIQFDYDLQNKDINKFSTLAHEYGHYFDNKVNFNLTFKEVDNINNGLQIGVNGEWIRRKASVSDEFLQAVREDKEFLRKTLNKEIREDLYKNDASGGVQDAIDGMFGIRINWGHGDSYYNRKYNSTKKIGAHKEIQAIYKNLGFDVSSQIKVKNIMRNYETASEVWANIFSSIICGGKELEYVKKYLPNSYNTMIKILKGAK